MHRPYGDLTLIQERDYNEIRKRLDNRWGVLAPVQSVWGIFLVYLPLAIRRPHLVSHHNAGDVFGADSLGDTEG